MGPSCLAAAAQTHKGCWKLTELQQQAHTQQLQQEGEQHQAMQCWMQGNSALVVRNGGLDTHDRNRTHSRQQPGAATTRPLQKLHMGHFLADHHRLLSTHAPPYAAHAVILTMPADMQAAGRSMLQEMPEPLATFSLALCFLRK